MSKIWDRLHNAELGVVKDGLALPLKNAALAAIMKGMASPEWKSYMSLFADNAAQLRRLTEESPTDENWFPEARAYIVSNPVCGADSTTVMTADVAKAFDLNLDDQADGTIVDPTVPNPPAGVLVRPFVIPQS